MAFASPPEMLLRKSMVKRRLENHVVFDSQSTYRAAVCVEFGKPLQIHRLPRQAKLKENEVRIAVERMSINFADVLQIRGQYQERQTPPFVPGMEFAGAVAEIGADVKRFKPGDRVIPLMSNDGKAWASEVVAPENILVHLPGSIPYDVGAVLLIPYNTGLMILEDKGEIKEGAFVLVTAAAGATGLAAVDLAANVFKAKVIGCAGGAEKCALLKQYGAYGTVDYTKENIPEKVRQITNGKKVDVVYELVGGNVFKDCLKCCGFGSRILVVGFTSGEIPQIPSNILLAKTVTIHGVYGANYYFHKREFYFRTVDKVIELCRQGRIRPRLDSLYPMSEVNEAIDRLNSRKTAGRVVLDPEN